MALGVAVARPGRPVVAVVGDGGLEMVAGELGTLRDRGLPVVVVVFQDASLALIELKQAAAGLPRAGVGLGRTDLAGLARAFGGHGVTVADVDALRTALREALSASRFTLVACAFEADRYVDAF
jgi:acetolactate synthase-1/2/3 large subunit